MFYLYVIQVFFNRQLYKEMDNGDDVIPIQFGWIAKFHSTQASYPNWCCYISNLLDKTQIDQSLYSNITQGIYYLFFVHFLFFLHELFKFILYFYFFNCLFCGHWVLVIIDIVRRKV